MLQINLRFLLNRFKIEAAFKKIRNNLSSVSQLTF